MITQISSPEMLVEKWIEVESRPDDDPVQFVEECRRLYLLQFRAQQMVDESLSDNVYQLFLKCGILVTKRGKVRCLLNLLFNLIRKVLTLKGMVVISIIVLTFMSCEKVGSHLFQNQVDDPTEWPIRIEKLGSEINNLLEYYNVGKGSMSYAKESSILNQVRKLKNERDALQIRLNHLQGKPPSDK